ncbi:MAG: hypothetical protein AAB887_00570 [Patescibacteria group bacterium]
MRKVIIILIILALGITPLLTQGNLYFVGGDDMRLYYMYPKEYIQNLLLNIVTDNSISGGNMGYYPATHPVPLVALIWLVKTLVPANTQFVMYGINWSLSFLFFYLLMGFWISDKSRFSFFAKVASCLIYIFSPFLFMTFYKHQMIVLFLITAFPGVLYFFIKSVRQRNPLYVFSACLIISIFSTNLSSIPWMLPMFITSTPLLFWEFYKDKKTFFWHAIIFVICYFLLNISWIFHLVYLTIYNTGLVDGLSSYLTPEFLKANIAGILGTSRQYSPLNGVVSQLVIGLTKNLTIVSYVNLIFIFLIVAAGVFIKKERNNILISGFILGLLSLLISWIMLAPNIQTWGPDAFIWLSLRVPFFTMFRNMSDKFALPMAFFYALTLGSSLVILANRFANKALRLIVRCSLSVVILINIYPLLQNRSEHVGVAAKMSGSFNDDFNALADYLLTLKNPSRILWLPLNFPSFINIEDKYNPGHYYSGPSPLRFLSNRQDYAGQFSFISSNDFGIADKIFPMIDAKDFKSFGKLIQLRNARYIILDKQQLPETMKPYLYNHYSIEYGKLKMQTEEFVNEFIGKKLQEFGTRYVLYEINPKYNNDRIYLTDSYEIFPKNLPNIEYEKVSDSLYNISLKSISKSRKLVFLDSYYKDWTLYVKGDSETKAYQKGKNVPVQGFANGWEINLDEIIKNFSKGYYTTNMDGSINIKMTLYFEPSKYNKPTRIISAMTFVILGLSQLILLAKRNNV